MSLQKIFFIFLLALSCASNTLKNDFPIRTPKSSNSNLAFGFVSPAWGVSIDRVSLGTVGKFKDAYDAKAHLYANGLFFVEGLGSGRHRVNVNGWTSGYEFEVNYGGLTYVGSFVVGFDSQYQGKVVTAVVTPLNSPEQFTVLCWLEAALKDNPWYFIVLGYHEDMYQDRSCTPPKTPATKDDIYLKDPFSK